MQLKKIILKGFKSFPDKTVLEFDEGVTAIVGPNGSGKSNIIEAIRWVMGEQSAKTLRGNRMNDVIFSGTHKRKSLNIAEVELILDNSNGYLDIEYEELSILRRLSRTGQSTYMINKQECRLKDILDLFMDSGLGKESFSVISQGEVEAIFNSKPEDRRGIIEEAAGVFKYKVRKEDAERKLDQTQENLDRIEDILYELESQLAPLEKQSNIAKTYLKYQEKLTDLDLAVSVWQIEELAEKIEQDKTKQQTVSEEYNKLESNVQELEKEKVATEQKLAKNRVFMEELNEELLTVVREKERFEASLNLYDEKSKHQEAFIEEKEHSIQEVKNRKNEQRKLLTKYEESYSKQKQKLEKIEAQLNELEKRRRYLEGDKNAQMENLRSEYIDYLQKQSSVKNEISYLEQELSRNQVERNKVDHQVSELKQEIQDKENTLGEKTATFEGVTQELSALIKDYQGQNKQLQTLKSTLTSLAEELTEKSTTLERAKAKVVSLNEMKESYAGYYAGVRAVMQEKERFSGVVGTVAELITIPSDYLLAINTVLGSSGQFIIVENEKDGRDAITYLKKNQRGRATFLPLTTIRPRNIPSSVRKQLDTMPGYLGIASELIDYPKKTQDIIENLLGQTVVAASLEEANAIARTIRFRNRVVSIEGDVINAGGSMTGGGHRNNLNPIFSQKAELEKLELFLQENNDTVEQLKEKHEDIKEKERNLEQEVEAIRLAGEETRLKEQSLKSEIQNLEEQLHREKRELEASSFEVTENQELTENYQLRLKKNKQSLKEIEEKVQSANESMQLLTTEQETIDSEREKISSKIETVQEERNVVREDFARENLRIEHAKNQIKDYKQQIEKLQRDIESFDGEFPQGSKEELTALFEEHQQKELVLEGKQKDAREKVLTINQYLEKTNHELKQLTKRNQTLADEKNKIAIRLSKNDVRMDYLLDYLVEEYQISYEDARLYDQPKLELADAKKKVKLLKKDIKELGPINLNSIEEFESVHERYEFLSMQQHDLLDAKGTLFNTMDEMDIIVEKHFKKTFDQIQKEFSKVFPQMFGGGHAELVLSEPENLLETGIEIIAQPPGKRLTQLSLLSGGERALTAISLLFSIIHVNPIPFCILDEAEAALDDANVVRFGEYLNDFENDTQFIVITHRKGTMEHSDQLYGITMQEKGISKIVGVSLREAQEIEGVT